MKPRHNYIFRSALLIVGVMSALITLAASQPVHAQAKQTSIMFDGDFANFSFVDEHTGAFSFLQVSRGGAKQQPQTFMFLHTENFNPNTNLLTIVDGSGFIPNADFTGGSGLSLRRFTLNTNTTNNPDFSVEVSICDVNTWDCVTNPISGVITGDFQETRSFFHRFQGSNEVQFVQPGGTLKTIRTVGTQLNASAKVQASVFGLVFTNVPGGIGSNHSVSVTIEKPAN